MVVVVVVFFSSGIICYVGIFWFCCILVRSSWEKLWCVVGGRKGISIFSGLVGNFGILLWF